jgi:hypothetical protein
VQVCVSKGWIKISLGGPSSASAGICSFPMPHKRNKLDTDQQLCYEFGFLLSLDEQHLGRTSFHSRAFLLVNSAGNVKSLLEDLLHMGNFQSGRFMMGAQQAGRAIRSFSGRLLLAKG